MHSEANLLSANQAAAHIGISPWTLKKWRTLGRGPNFVRMGSNLGTVRYRLIDLQSFLEASVVNPADDRCN